MLKYLFRLSLLLTLGITSSAEAVNYAANPVTRYIINTSSVSYGIMGVGDDATCDGSVALPCLTLTKALTLVPAGGTIVLNGQSGSPQTYVATSGISVSNQVTISAYETGGAKIAGDGSITAITIPSANTDLRLVGVIVDPSLNNGSAGAKCVDFSSSPSSPGSFTATNVTFQGWTTHCIGQDTNGRGNITLTNVTATGGSVNGFLYWNNWYEGSLTITGGSCTITDMNNSASDGCVIMYGAGYAVGKQNTATITDFDVTITLANSGYVSNYGIYLYRVRYSYIDGGTHYCIGPTGSRQCNNARIETNVATETISGAYIKNLSIYNNAYGGIACGIGSDSATSAFWSLSEDVIIDACVVNSGTNAQNAGLHGTFLGGTRRGIIRNSSVINGGINYVDKETDSTYITLSTAAGCASSCVLAKGATNATYDYLTISQTVGFSIAPMLYIEVNNGTGTNSTGITVTRNTFTTAGATNARYITVDASQTWTPSLNTYSLTSGTNGTNKFSILGVNYTTCAAYQAVEVTAVCNIP